MQSGARRASIILGVFMAVVLMAGAILPLLNPNPTTTTQTIDPTDAPVPTFPPPISDFSTLSFEQNYLHPTGLFLVAQPTGYEVSQPNSSVTIAQVNMVDQTALSVIDAYVEDPGAPITPADLNARFDEATLDQSWSRFNNWAELSRRMDGDTLLIDFEVVLQSMTYVARQRVWTDGEWIYVVRVLAPENATDFLVHVLDQLVGTIQPFKVFAGTPFEWQAYYDHLLSHIIRYPSGWTVADSAPGRPTSIIGTNGEALRVEAQANTSVNDEEAARAWVERQRSGATILSVIPVTRDDVSGFSVAYAFQTVDGAPQSGLAVLLNGSDGALHVANLRFAGEDVDLNAVDLQGVETPALEATAEAEATVEAEVVTVDPNTVLQRNLALAMSTFRIMPPLNLSPSSLPQATPTPLPTVAPVEVTEEASEDVEAIEAEATDAAPTEEAVETEGDEAATEEAVAEEGSEEDVVTFEQLSETATAVAGAEATEAP